MKLFEMLGVLIKNTIQQALSLLLLLPPDSSDLVVNVSSITRGRRKGDASVSVWCRVLLF